jgi:type I restriction enzyme S subunit
MKDADEQITSLPNGWALTTVGEVCERMQYGTSEKATADSSGIPVLRMGNIKGGELSFHDLKHFPKDWSELDKFLLCPGDVLFNRTNSAELVGKTAVFKRHHLPAVFASYLIRAVPKENVYLPELMAAYINSSFGRAYIRSVSSQQVGQANVNSTKLASMPLPLPPLSEQHRIVSKIEELFTKLDAGVEELKKAKAQLKRYRQALLKEAVTGNLSKKWRGEQGNKFETASQLLFQILEEHRKKWEEQELTEMQKKGHEPRDNKWKARYSSPQAPDSSKLPKLPDGWVWANAQQINEWNRPCTYGVLQPGGHVEGGIPLIRVGDISDGKISMDGLKKISPKIADEYPRTTLRGGEVLMTLVGAIGRTAVVPKTLAGANTARAVGVISLDRLVVSEWVELWFRNPAMLAEMTCKAHEVARKTLNLEDVRVAPIALPSRQEQHVIVDEVERCLSIVDLVEQEVQKQLILSGRLRSQILSKAFSGKLIPQDPTDEPAEKLLERISQSASKSIQSKRKRKSNGDTLNGK